jgi:hypothetical protein
MQLVATPPSIGNDLASALLRRSARDFMSLQGIASVSSVATAPDQLVLRFATASFARLADNILRDVVDGVRLVLTSDTPTPPGQDDWWTGSYNQMFASVRAMPGVLDSSSSVEHGLKEVSFRTSDAATSARLRSIINEDLGGWAVRWSPFPAPSPVA